MSLLHSRMALSGAVFTLLTIVLATPSPAAGHPYYPLDTGTLHDYTSSGEGPEFYQLVVGPVDFQGFEAIRVDEFNYLGLGSARQWMVSESSGGDLLLHGNRIVRSDGSVLDQVYDPPVRLLPAVPTAGASWTDVTTIYRYVDGVQDPGTPAYTYSATVTAAAESVTVPAGTFDALVVTSDWGQDVTTTWYVPGVGIVREISPGGTRELWSDVTVPVSTVSWGDVKASFR